MPFAFTCEQCGVGFERHQRKLSRFCSIACKAAAQTTLPEPSPVPCPHCGVNFTPLRKEAARRKFCGHACAAAAHGGWPDPTPEQRAKMGDRRRRTGRGDGYVKRGGRHEHRVVAEQELGRPLQPGEIVAHRDGVKPNNAPANLEVFPNRSEFGRAISLRRHRKEPSNARD